MHVYVEKGINLYNIKVQPYNQKNYMYILLISYFHVINYTVLTLISSSVYTL